MNNSVLTPEQQKLVSENIKLVSYALGKLNIKCSSVEFEELYCAGEDGLIRAAKRFDSKRGTAFSSFAICCINSSFLMFIRRNKRTGLQNIISIYDNFINGEEITVEDTLKSNEEDCLDTIIREEELQELLALIVTLLNVRYQKIYLNYLKGVKQSEYSTYEMLQSHVSTLIKRIKIKIKEAYEFMENDLDKPRRGQFNSDKEYRAAYQKYYYHKKHENKARPKPFVENEESPLLNEMFPSKENNTEIIIKVLKKKIEKAKKELAFYSSILKELERK